jgi:uncharacterized protein
VTSRDTAVTRGAAPSAAAVGTLLRKEAYRHPVRELRLIETHISWVVLTGTFAYKLKKPVDYGFLDFSTPEKRRHFCEEEVRLNRRFAPELYLDVAEVTERGGLLSIGGDGKVVDHAVRMRQFDESALLSRELEAGQFGPAQATEVGHWLANLHGRLPPRATPGAGEPGSPQSLLAALEQNFLQLRQRLSKQPGEQRLGEIEGWALPRYRAIEELLRERSARGFVRESHGDLHLRNIVRLDGRLVPFDCIEFSEHFRILDLQAELAMLVMDIESRGRASEGNACFNAYLEDTGDYEGIGSASLFRCYYALVRAKVALLGQEPQEAGRYLELAHAYGVARKPALWLMHGFSGSGKTTVAGRMLLELDAVRVRSDVERKRLFGFRARSRSGAGEIREGIYSRPATEAAYGRLAGLAGVILASGRDCIVDAAFLDAGLRSLFAQVAAQHRAPCRIVSCRANPGTLRARVAQRSARAADASEAGPEVLDYQLARRDRLRPDEGAGGIVVDTDTPGWGEKLAAELRRLSH